MDKYNRNYELYIEKSNNETLKITLPFTVEFEIHRNSFSSANVCQIRVYNLAPNNRNQITKGNNNSAQTDQLLTLDENPITQQF